MSSATVSYQYAVKQLGTTLGSATYPYPRSISPSGYFSLYGKDLDTALLFESATKAEQAIARRNAFFGRYESFLVLPVKVTTTTETVTKTVRELA